MIKIIRLEKPIIPNVNFIKKYKIFNLSSYLFKIKKLYIFFFKLKLNKIKATN